LEYLKILWRRNILTDESELLLLSPRIMKLRNWPLITLTPSIPWPRYVLFPSIHFRFSSFLLMFLLFLTSLRFNLCAEPPITCFSSASTRGGTYFGGSGFCCF
jgi:hypothetical protein